MTIAHGDSVKKFTLYPQTKSIMKLEHTQCFQDTNDEEEIVQPILKIDQAMSLKKDIEENKIINFINNSNYIQFHGVQPSFDHILDINFQENCTIDTLSTLFDSMDFVNLISESCSTFVEIQQGKTLNINSKLEESQKKQLIQTL
jgi:hypothetical protein